MISSMFGFRDTGSGPAPVPKSPSKRERSWAEEVEDEIGSIQSSTVENKDVEKPYDGFTQGLSTEDASILDRAGIPVLNTLPPPPSSLPPKPPSTVGSTTTRSSTTINGKKPDIQNILSALQSIALEMDRIKENGLDNEDAKDLPFVRSALHEFITDQWVKEQMKGFQPKFRGTIKSKGDDQKAELENIWTSGYFILNSRLKRRGDPEYNPIIFWPPEVYGDTELKGVPETLWDLLSVDTEHAIKLYNSVQRARGSKVMIFNCAKQWAIFKYIAEGIGLDKDVLLDTDVNRKKFLDGQAGGDSLSGPDGDKENFPKGQKSGSQRNFSYTNSARGSDYSYSRNFSQRGRGGYRGKGRGGSARNSVRFHAEAYDNTRDRTIRAPRHGNQQFRDDADPISTITAADVQTLARSLSSGSPIPTLIQDRRPRHKRKPLPHERGWHGGPSSIRGSTPSGSFSMSSGRPWSRPPVSSGQSIDWTLKESAFDTSRLLGPPLVDPSMAPVAAATLGASYAEYANHGHYGYGDRAYSTYQPSYGHQHYYGTMNSYEGAAPYANGRRLNMQLPEQWRYGVESNGGSAQYGQPGVVHVHHYPMQYGPGHQGAYPPHTSFGDYQIVQGAGQQVLGANPQYDGVVDPRYTPLSDTPVAGPGDRRHLEHPRFRQSMSNFGPQPTGQPGQGGNRQPPPPPSAPLTQRPRPVSQSGLPPFLVALTRESQGPVDKQLTGQLEAFKLTEGDASHSRNTEPTLVANDTMGTPASKTEKPSRRGTEPANPVPPLTRETIARMPSTTSEPSVSSWANLAGSQGAGDVEIERTVFPQDAPVSQSSKTGTIGKQKGDRRPSSNTSNGPARREKNEENDAEQSSAAAGAKNNNSNGGGGFKANHVTKKEKKEAKKAKIRESVKQMEKTGSFGRFSQLEVGKDGTMKLRNEWALQ